MTKKNKIIGLSILGLLLFSQIFQINKKNPASKAEEDFIHVQQPSEELATILKDACYDCHSNQTTYPWYTYVVPLSYWINNHIVKGRKKLNFSIWATYEAEKQAHKLEESIEKVSKRQMPIKSYTIMHSNARLSDAQVKLLEDWLTTQFKTYVDKPE